MIALQATIHTRPDSTTAKASGVGTSTTEDSEDNIILYVAIVLVVVLLIGLIFTRRMGQSGSQDLEYSASPSTEYANMARTVEQAVDPVRCLLCLQA